MKIDTLHKPTLCALFLVLAGLTSCKQPKTEVSPESPRTASAGTPAYPLKVSSNGRYVVDQNNTPFLIVGDTPQGLIYRLSEKQADDYFADRQAHGFNTMGWIDVLCAGRDYPANIYAATPDGIRPFTGFVGGGSDWTHYDLSKPNEAYFVRLDHIVELAAKHGHFVFLDPIETAGWLSTLRNNGLEAASAYGRFLGNRYKKYANVAWLNGNDFGGWQNASDDALVLAVAKGIKSVDPDQIQTVEFNPPWGSSLDDASWAALISINGAYIYGPTYIQVLHNYNQTPVMPVFLMEAHYELENVGRPPDFGTPPVLRREEYWAMLSGGKGQFYGNMYTWSFKPGWEKNIDTPGVTQVTIWKNFFTSLPWQDLVPDQDHSILTAGFGTPGDINQPAVSKSDYATASKTPDGSFVIVYMPTARTITVNLAALKANASAQWFDPTNGAYTSIPGSPLSNTGTQKFTPPEKNHDGDSDWVLLLDASK
jgi:Protein of unknown function (DUF4038)/Putative collagen-binding domain of a collagenase